MKIAVIAGWIARVLLIILTLVNSRLLIELVGVDGLAVQSILISLMAWFALLNLGIPSAVQNLISRYRAEKRDYEKLKQTACNALMVLFIVFLPLIIGIGAGVKYFLLGEYPYVATSAVMLFCIGIFISGLGLLFNQILYAEQRGEWPNIYPAINALFVTSCLLFFRWRAIDDINLVLMAFVISNLLVFAIGATQAKAFRIWILEREHLTEIWRDCRGFALFAFLAAGVLGIDYIVMSRLLSAQDVAVYSITQRVFMALFSVHAIILTSAWSGVSEVLFAKQWVIARRRVRNLLLFGISAGTIIGGVVILLMGRVVDLISHHKITVVPLSLSLLFLLYALLRIWSDTFAMGLLSIGETKILNRYVPFQAIVSIAGQIILGSKYGTTGIMFGLIISFILTAAWILPIKFYKITSESKYEIQ